MIKNSNFVLMIFKIDLHLKISEFPSYKMFENSNNRQKLSATIYISFQLLTYFVSL